MKDFNLLYQSWIFCKKGSDLKSKYSISDVLQQAHEIDDLSDPIPIVKGAVYRLLLAILARVFGPANYSAWQELHREGKFDDNMLNEYFKKWEHRFNLFDPDRSFYQSPDSRVMPKTPLKLMPHLASGNNATLFDHHIEEEGISISPEVSARYVLALQYYGLGGLSGLKEQKFTAAPSCRGISFFIQGKNLFETLLLNMIAYTGKDDYPIPTDEEDEDLPCWEMDDPFDDRTEPYGLLDYLTWQNRRVLLFPEIHNNSVLVQTITEGPGLVMDNHFINGATVRDPYQYYREGSTKAPLVLRFSEEHALWRNSAALLRYEDKLSPPENLKWIKELIKKDMIDYRKTLNILAVGMAADKAKVLFYRSSSFPLPLVYLQKDELVMELETALSYAESVRKSIYGAVSTFATGVLSFDSDKKEGRSVDTKDKNNLVNHLGAERVYWGALEPHFYHLITQLPEDREGSLYQWKKSIQNAAWDALDHAVRLTGDSIECMKASVKAQSILGRGLKEHLGDLKKGDKA